MIAKFAGRCEVCAAPIQPGDSITARGKAGSGPWVHADCRSEPASAAQGTSTRTSRQRPGRGETIPVPDGAIAVYTDGACSGSPGPGGWAWAVDQDRHASGSDPVTTNQRMEIRAALEAVKALPGELVVVSDSAYVVNCFRDGWWRNWRSRGWTTAAKKPVANRDLWEPLVDLVDERGDVTFRWVKGHSGDAMNDLADRLAVEAKINQT